MELHPWFSIVPIFVLLIMSLSPCIHKVAATPSCHFPAIFNFGDSNSDTGGLSAVFGQAQFPHGESYFHHPAGRYCDGRLIIDFIAKSLGLPYLSAYLDSVGSNFKHGANFATAGSTIRPQNTTLRQSGFSPISLDVQWIEFNDFHRRSQIVRSRGGFYKKLLPKHEDFSRALYTFDIGQNDLTSAYFLNMSTSQVKAYIPDILHQFKNVISYIYGVGGRNFWIHNTGPFGCLAYVLERIPHSASEIDKAGCGIPFNGVAQYFNRGLKNVVAQLRKELPLAAITYVDIYSLKYELISRTRKHGFNESLRACCGHGGKYNYNRNIGCGGKITVRGKQVMVGKPCRDPSVWINWDGVHYTQAANQWIFQQIVGGSYSDPPIPLKMCLISSVVLVSVLISFSVSNPVKSKASCDFPAIFNFGDSNSDTGGLSAAFGYVPPPNGETFFHHPAGRYSDGRLMIDFIAESLGLPYLSAYLDSVGSNFSHGANFATAGSTIRPQNTTMSQSGYSPISLNVQFIQYSDFQKRSQNFINQGGVFATLLPKADYFRKALYTFDIGQNDLTAGYKLNLTTDQVKANVPDMISQFSDAVKSVYAQGGRSFWIHNTGPVGCYPYSLDRFLITVAQVDKYGCATPFNEVSQYFNRKLKEAVVQLRQDLPQAAITYVDIYSLKYTLITQAKKFGFETPFIACCGHGGKYNYNTNARCGAKKIVDGKEVIIANSCKDPSVKIIWDGVHFTEAANKWIFQKFVNGFFSDPPTPLIMACQR